MMLAQMSDVCVCVSVYLRVCVHVMCLRACVEMCMYVCACRHIFVFVCVCVCVRARALVCKPVFVNYLLGAGTQYWGLWFSLV